MFVFAHARLSRRCSLHFTRASRRVATVCPPLTALTFSATLACALARSCACRLASICAARSAARLRRASSSAAAFCSAAATSRARRASSLVCQAV